MSNIWTAASEGNAERVRELVESGAFPLPPRAQLPPLSETHYGANPHTCRHVSECPRRELVFAVARRRLVGSRRHPPLPRRTRRRHQPDRFRPRDAPLCRRERRHGETRRRTRRGPEMDQRRRRHGQFSAAFFIPNTIPSLTPACLNPGRRISARRIPSHLALPSNSDRRSRTRTRLFRT